MSKWIIAAMAVATVMIAGIAGCGAKLPTVSDQNSGDPVEQKVQLNTDYNEDVTVDNNVI